MGSCKDYDEDQYNDLIHKIADQEMTLTSALNSKVADLQSQIDALKSAQEACKAECSAKLSALEAANATQDATIAAQAAAIAALQAQDQMLQSAIDALESAIATASQTAQADLAAAVSQVNQDIAQAAAAAAAAQFTADSIAAAIVGWGPALETAYQNAANAYALAKMDSIRIDALDALTDKQQGQIDSLAAVTTALYKLAADNLQEAKDAAAAADEILRQEILDEVDVRVAAVEAAMKLADDALAEKIDALNTKVTALATRITNAEAAISALESAFNNLKDAVSKLITSIEINGTSNPVFGSFAWPTGIRSNMLIAYYGEFTSAVKFPTTQTGHLVEGCDALDDIDAELLGTLDSHKILPGTIVGDGEDNAGKIYFTVNPNTVDLTGDEFTLVNSQNVESAAIVGNVVPSTDVLSFGFSNVLPTRGTVTAQNQETSFYEAPVKVDADNLDPLKIKLDEGLKSAVKNALQNRTLSVSALANGIYGQLTDIAAANAIKATWSDSEGSHSTRSNYDVAVAAIQPLSYHALSGISMPQLPKVTSLGDVSFTVGSISGLDFSTINFNISGISAHVTFGTVTISSTGVPQVTVEKPIHADPITGDITYQTVTYNVDGLSTLLTDIQNDLNSTVGSWEVEVNNQIDSMIAQIQSSINNEIQDMLNDISGQLTDKVNDLLDDVVNSVTNNVNSYIGKLNSLINRYNSAADRINNLLGDVNSKLQVAMFYEDKNGDLHQLSNSAALPAVFTGTGAIQLFPTSYTFDIAAPSYQKFVAVTNVIDLNDASKSARNGDANCVSILKNTNNSNEYFNTVLEGGRYGISFAPAQSGYTYEIVYSAVDYHGWISTRKFYVTVK